MMLEEQCSLTAMLLQTPQACSSVLTNNTCTPEHIQLKMGLYDNKKQEIHRLAEGRVPMQDGAKYASSNQWMSSPNVIMISLTCTVTQVVYSHSNTTLGVRNSIQFNSIQLCFNVHIQSKLL